MLLFLNAVCVADKQKIPFKSLVRPGAHSRSNSRSTALEVSTPIITPQMRFISESDN
jgi:hypothetical protein